MGGGRISVPGPFTKPHIRKRLTNHTLLGQCVQDGAVDILRQQIFQVGFGLGQRQFFEKVAEVKIRFQSVGFCGFDEAEHGGTGFGPGRVTIEHPVLPAQNEGPDGIFDQVAVWPEPAVIDVAHQAGPVVQGVTDGLAEKAFGGC